VDKHVHERVGHAFHARENEAFREDGENMSIQSSFSIKGLRVEHVDRTGPCGKIPGKTGLDAAVHNRTGSGLTAGRFRASPAACAASRAELSTLPVDKCVHDGVGRAFHAPDFMGFREYGQKMTNSIFM
jgi:hypothetical protein